MSEEKQLSKSQFPVVVMLLFLTLTLGLAGMVFWLAGKIMTLDRTVRETRLTVPPEMREKIQFIFTQESQTIAEIGKQEIQNAANQIAKLTEQKIVGNEKAAEAAFQTALELTQKKDFTQAKIYCLNAINHAPNTGKYFEQLMEIIKQSGPGSVAELEQIRSVLELGMYQVDCKDVPVVAEMLVTINTRLSQTAQANVEAERRREKNAIDEELEQLKSGEFVWGKLLEKNADECIFACRTRLSKLHALTSGTPLTDKDAEFCKQEIGRTEILLEYSATLAAIDRMLTQAAQLLAGKPQQSDLPAINSMVQTANGILSRAWNINFDALSETHHKKIVAQADRIARIELEFNRIKSEPAIRKIQGILAEMDAVPNETYTGKINYLQQRIQSVGLLFAEVYDPAARRDIESRMAKYPAEIRNLNQARYKAYQQWAVKQCDSAFAQYKKWNIVTDDDAISLIRNYLTGIDSSLLTPEVSRLYQDVLQKQFAKMNWKKIAEWESNLASCTKKTLEDF